jgi:hypothetical protein
MQSDVLVHIADAVAALDGVHEVRGSPRARKLPVVYYDRCIASARRVLRAVQPRGFTASLAGF